MIEILDVSRDVHAARRLHAFLLPHFGREELESLSVFEAEASGSGPVDTIMLMGLEAGRVACGAVAGRIPLRDAQGVPSADRILGAIGHALVDPALRGRGVGREISLAAEQTIVRYAEAAGQQLVDFILESEMGARLFWSRMGYRWPQGLRYWQPPLAYHPDGTPALPIIPLFMMIRRLDASVSTISAETLRTYTRSVLWYWYREALPDTIEDPAAVARAAAWLDAEVIAPSLATIADTDDPIALVDLATLSAEEGAHWLAPIDAFRR